MKEERRKKACFGHVESALGCILGNPPVRLEMIGNGSSYGCVLHPGFVNSAYFVVKIPRCKLESDTAKT